MTLKALKTMARPALKRAVITAGLETSAALAGIGMARQARGCGAIFTLHHVRPDRPGPFRPNAILEITPDFLDAAIVALKAEGYDFIALDDLPARLAAPGARPFACMTLDDGYRDNAKFAAPVFARHGVPYTIFITRGFIERTHSMWWETLEALLVRVERFDFDFGAGIEPVDVATPLLKMAAFDRIAAFINAAADEASAIARLDRVAMAHGLDPLALTAELTMDGAALQALLADPLVSYGAHTVSHRGLARLDQMAADFEIAASIAKVEEICGRKPRAFAYPYGDQRSVSPRERQILASLGLPVAVTTRPGTLQPGGNGDLTAIPRISLNGLYQKPRYVRALASGLPFKLTG
jgi:peptidoglycan/xylan/chitin deacetylase (PgdA/CDA1 family)